MDIDITEMQNNEIIHILTSYPNGHLTIKNSRAIWSTEVAGQELHPTPPMNNGGGGRPPQQNKDVFGKMQESLFRSVCG